MLTTIIGAFLPFLAQAGVWILGKVIRNDADRRKMEIQYWEYVALLNKSYIKSASLRRKSLAQQKWFDENPFVPD